MSDDPNAPATKADLEKVIEQMRDMANAILLEFRKVFDEIREGLK